jgi:hypothetical protein
MGNFDRRTAEVDKRLQGAAAYPLGIALGNGLCDCWPELSRVRDEGRYLSGYGSHCA